MCTIKRDSDAVLHLAAYHRTSAAIINRLLAVGGQDEHALAVPQLTNCPTPRKAYQRTDDGKPAVRIHPQSCLTRQRINNWPAFKTLLDLLYSRHDDFSSTSISTCRRKSKATV